METILSLLLSGSNTNSEVVRNSSVSTLQGSFPMLYAKAKNGNIRSYSIKVIDHGKFAELITEKSTTLGGAVQTDNYIYRTGVNIGKSNESTYLEKALFDAQSTFNKLLDQGFTTTLPTEKFNTDSFGFMKPMLAISFNSKKVVFEPSALVQPKYDGVRCLAFEDSTGDVKLMSRQGKPYDIPHIKEWLENHRDLLPLDGELYCHKKLTFQEIISAVKKKSELTKEIKYVIYDKPVEGMTNKQRWDELKRLFSEIHCTEVVYLSDFCYAKDMADVRRYHDEYVKQGYEGAIIRNLRGMYEFGFRSNDLIKLKVFNDKEFEIVDVVEATGRDSGTAIFVLKAENGQEFKAKPQGSRELRTEYFDNADELIGKMCTVQFQGLSDDGIPRFPSAISVRDYE